MEQPLIDAVLFDLDGTLLDTLEDLSASANYALNACGYSTVSQERVRLTVGNGAFRLMCDLAGIPPQESAETAKLLEAFMSHYGQHCEDATAPFPGIMELLTSLKARGIKTGVVSNKPDSATKKLCAQFFGDSLDFALGSTPDLPRKPAPEVVFAALNALGSTPDHTAYIGDSEPDVLVANNAQVALSVMVSWGFRTREQLEAAGATLIVDNADDILEAITTAKRG